MQLERALTRKPGADFANGLSTSDLGRPDYSRMRTQHHAYEELLRELGLQLTSLPPLPGYPDAYFVEDAAVVLPQLAVITRPGAPSRQGETDSIALALAQWRELAVIEAPATLDGGDVLVVGRRAFIGVSDRTNRAGAEALAAIFGHHGLRSTLIEVRAGLHLKSDVCQVGEDLLLLSPAFATHPAFADYRRIELHRADAYAANALFVNGRVVIPAGFARVREALEAAGQSVAELDTGEARRMDGGLTCMSLRF